MISLLSIAALSLAMEAASASVPGALAGPIAGYPHREQFDVCRKQADEKRLRPDTGRRQFIRACLRPEHGGVPAQSKPATSGH